MGKNKSITQSLKKTNTGYKLVKPFEDVLKLIGSENWGIYIHIYLKKHTGPRLIHFCVKL